MRRTRPNWCVRDGPGLLPSGGRGSRATSLFQRTYFPRSLYQHPEDAVICTNDGFQLRLEQREAY
eukprot:1776888-Rhodomonas_salina.1